MVTLKTLHILNKSPEHSRHRLCLTAIGPEDGLLLTENGVLTATKQFQLAPGRYFALRPDLEARGLSPQATQAKAISFDEMVELTASAQKVISW